MRDQYVGDISDLLKFGFLRALAGTDRTLGVAWYYVPSNDGRADGQHREWCDEPAWRRLDERVYIGLSTLPERSVAALERAEILPTGTLFHREPMPSRANRRVWCAQKRETLEAADIVFLDPDKGLGNETEQHATAFEIRLLRQPGRAVAVIKFPGRHQPYDASMQDLHDQLTNEAAAERVITLRTSVSVSCAKKPGSFVPRERWFTVIDPDATLESRVQKFAEDLKSLPRVNRAELKTQA